MATTFAQIKLRRDSAVNWTAEDPILAAGEFGVDLTTLQFKIGDGTTPWSGLLYQIGVTQVVDGSVATPEPLSEPVPAPSGSITFLIAEGDGGPVVISNIGAGAPGATLTIYGRSATNTVTLNAAGNILVNGGTIILALGSVITLICDGTNWVEVNRNGV